jgi:hypothetical protein
MNSLSNPDEGKITPAELKHDHDRGEIHKVSFDEIHSILFITDISCVYLHQLKSEPVQVLLLGSSMSPAGFYKPHSTGDRFRSSDHSDFVLVVAIEGVKYERVGLAIAVSEWQLFRDVSASKTTLV